MHGPLQALAVRLCLVMALLMGVSPGQGVVICVGPEGTFTLELSFEEARCGGCPELAEQGRGQARGATLGDPADCPCRDYTVIAEASQAPAKPRHVDMDQLAMASVPVDAPVPDHHAAFAAAAARIRPSPHPRRTAPRTLVLRV